ncbi:PaaI family thioesterase [Bacteroidota bacterium]
MERLGIEFTEISGTSISGTLKVDHRTIQPFGYLHGGALTALAETLASAGSVLQVFERQATVFGNSIHANHVKSATDGIVTGRAKSLHLGKTTHVWEVDIVNEQGELLSKCTVTNIIMYKNK